MRYTMKVNETDYVLNENAEEEPFEMRNKLGQLEDLMEKHDINSVEELEHVILNNATGEQAFNNFVNYTVKPFLTKRVNFQTLIPIIEKGWTWEDYMDKESDKNTGEHQFANERLTEIEFNSIREFLLKLEH